MAAPRASRKAGAVRMGRKKGNSCVLNNCSLAFFPIIAFPAANCNIIVNICWKWYNMNEIFWEKMAPLCKGGWLRKAQTEGL